jgi:ATP-dependent DNA helicase RecG
LRGPGEFIGTRQHGLPELKLANIIKDQELLKKARISAEILLSKSPTLSDFLLLKEIAKRRLKDKIEFLIS